MSLGSVSMWFILLINILVVWLIFKCYNKHFWKKKYLTPKKTWYPIKPQLSYNGHLSTTDTISCHKMAVMEKFDCYSNYHTFIVVSKNFSFYCAYRGLINWKNFLYCRAYSVFYTHLRPNRFLIQLLALMHVMHCEKNSLHSIVAVWKTTKQMQFSKTQGKKFWTTLRITVS